jgi:hypothetical protein
MGFMDALKGLFGSEVVQGALGSTPLGELGDQLGAQLGDGAAAVEAAGVDVAQLTDAVPGSELLPADLGAALDGIDPTGTADPSVT